MLFNLNFKANAKNLKLESSEIATFEEYQEEIQKFDYIILIVAPAIIIGIGVLFYVKKNKKI